MQAPSLASAVHTPSCCRLARRRPFSACPSLVTRDTLLVAMVTGAISLVLRVLGLGFVLACCTSAPPAAAALTEFPIPSGTAVTGAITAGPDGALWFPTQKGNKSQISRLSTSGSYSEFGGLTDPRPGYTGTRGITAGPDGRLWFTEYDAHKIGAISTTGVVIEYSTGLSPGAAPDQITAGPDGRLWFTEPGVGKIGAITTSGTITEYPLAQSKFGLQDITTGPDGALWFIASSGYIGRITTQGAVTEHYLSDSISPDLIINAGGSLLFTERNDIYTYDHEANAFYGHGNRPLESREIASMAVGSDGAIWFTESIAAFIGRKLAGGIYTNEIFLSAFDASPLDIAAGPDGALWFTATGIADKIGRITTDVPPPPTLEVRLSVFPAAVADRFALSIDGKWLNTDAGDGDTTGKHSVGVTYHRVGWTYRDSGTPRYWRAITCKNQGGAGDTVARSGVFDADFDMLVPTASEGDIVCTVALRRRDPPTGLTVSQNGGVVNASWTLLPATVTGYLEFSPTPDTDPNGFFTDPKKIMHLFDSSEETFDSTPGAFPPGTYYVHVSAHPPDCDSFSLSCVHEFSRPPVSLIVPGPPTLSNGTPAAPPATASPADTVAAFSSLLVRKRQKIGSLHVRAAMGESGTISARGTVTVARSSRSYKLRLVTAPTVAGRSVKLQLKLSRKAHNAVRRAIRRYKKGSAKITITATDFSGNIKREQRIVALRP
jgi:streptogramin lyase